MKLAVKIELNGPGHGKTPALDDGNQGACSRAVRVQHMRHSEERMWPWSMTKRLVRRVTVGISAAYGAPA